MLSTRLNQENVIYEQQTAAAAKPLNQTGKGLAPKTPANKGQKTPFKISQNDENIIFAGGKTGGKGKRDGLFGEGKGGKVDGNAFITPAAPRDRAPLGNKTTNAKATAFQTPAPPTQEKPSAKPSSPRMRRAKIKVHEAEAAVTEDDQEEPDIEYMPPRVVPLPDYPDDCWPHDRTYPQFEGRNLTRGWWSAFAPQKDDDDDDEFSDFEEKLKQSEREKQSAQQAKKSAVVKTSGLPTATKDPLTAKQPQTLKARSAASALSHATVPSFAAPTAAAKARMPSAITSKKPKDSSRVAGENTRYGAAKVASNSTLGYSKGRAVSASTKKHPSDFQGSQRPSGAERASSPMKTSLDDLFIMTGGLDISGDVDDDLGGGVPVSAEDEEDEEVFQLPAVKT